MDKHLRGGKDVFHTGVSMLYNCIQSLHLRGYLRLTAYATAHNFNLPPRSAAARLSVLQNNLVLLANPLDNCHSVTLRFHSLW